jgi:hypothetical protein
MPLRLHCYTPDKTGCRGEAAMNDKWWGWLGLIILFLIFQGLRAAFRGMKDNANTGMARLNAAAERILKERGVSASNPIPRTTPAKKIPGAPATSQVRRHPAVPKSSSTPAVIRRGGLLAGSKEPVIQRRR